MMRRYQLRASLHNQITNALCALWSTGKLHRKRDGKESLVAVYRLIDEQPTV